MKDTMREGASRQARSFSIGGDHGPGGQIPAWSLLRGFVAEDDGVALVVAGVDVADGHGTAIGLADREERDGGQEGDRCVY